MKIRKNEVHERDKIELQMTPMIDIVFQLLVFFIMTFKIVPMEGDFQINMPQAAQGAPSPSLMVPLKVKLSANANGQLVSVALNSNVYGGSPKEQFSQLQDAIVQQIGVSDGPGSIQEESEIEIDADFQLDYFYTIRCITAVSGRIDPQTGEVQKLIEKIKFSPGSGTGP